MRPLCTSALLGFYVALAVTACSRKTIPQLSSPGMGSCEGLPALAFQNIEDSISGERVAKFAFDVAVAAKADVKIAQTPVSTDDTVRLKAEFGRKVNEHLKVSSHVTEEFWQQDIVFRQTICFLERQSEKTSIPEAERASIRKSLREIVEARAQYSLQFDKKNKAAQ